LKVGLSLRAGTRSFVFDIADGQPQQLDHYVIGGKWPRFLMIFQSW